MGLNDGVGGNVDRAAGQVNWLDWDVIVEKSPASVAEKRSPLDPIGEESD